MIHEDALAQLAGEARAMLLRSGVWARTTNDIAAHEASMTEARGRENHPVLSVDHHDFAEDDAFGILIEASGKLIGGMVCKHIRLGRDNLANHLRSSNYRVYGRGLVETNSSVAGELTGRLVYQGELFLNSEFRKGKVSVSAIMHLAHSLCALKWHADWHYAFMPVGLLGKVPAFGFHHYQLCTQTYDEKVALRSSKECLVYSSARDICERAVVISKAPELLDELSAKSSS